MSDEQMTLRLIASVLQDVSKRLEDHQTALDTVDVRTAAITRALGIDGELGVPEWINGEEE